MEINSQLSELSSHQNLYPAERIILLALYEYENRINSEIDSALFSCCVKSVSDLLKINSGNLSMQCSIRIGEILHFLYSSVNKRDQISELINALTEKPTPSSLFVIGYITKRMEKVVPSLFATLLILGDDLIFPVLFALKCCYSIYTNDDFEFIKPSVKLAKQVAGIHDESIQLMCVEMLLKIQKTKTLPPTEFTDIISILIANHESVFVAESACKLLARVSLQMINKTNETETLKDALISVASYTQFINITFSHFFPMLSVDFIQRQFPLIAGFIVEHVPSFMPLFSQVLTKDTKMELYNFYEQSGPDMLPNFDVLENLDYDEKSRFNIAALAYDLVVCDDLALRQKGAAYFSVMFSKNRQLTIRFLNSALLFLADPPDEYPRLTNNIKSKALIAANIISSVDFKNRILKGSEANISKFLNRAFVAPNLLKGEFASAFVLMSSLPPEFIPLDRVYEALLRFSHFFKGKEITTMKERKRSYYVGSAVAVFLAAHPYIPGTSKTFQQMLTNRALVTPISKLGAFLSIPKMQATPDILNVLVSRIHGEIMTINPSYEYLVYRIKYPMLCSAELLHGSVFVMPHFSSVFLNNAPEDLTIRIVESYVEYMKHVPETIVPNEIRFLFQDEMNKTSSMVLLNALLCDEKTASYLPLDTHKFLLKRLEEIKNVPRIQLIAESLSMWSKYHPETLLEIINYISNWRSYSKCLIYAALFTHAQLPESLIIQMMLDMNNLAKVPKTCAFALFALSVLYNAHFQELTSLNFTNTQCTFLLDLMQTPLSLVPYNLYFMSQVFVSLLPILSAELETTRSEIYPTLVQLLSTFSQTRMPFATQIMFMTARTANQLAPQLLQTISFNFPDISMKSYSVIFNTYGLFSDILNFGVQKDDLFSEIPNALMYLQVVNDVRGSDFIIAVANQFINCSDPNNPKHVQRLSEWISIIYSVLVLNIIPGLSNNTPIFPSIPPKKCLLQVAKLLIPLIKNFKHDGKQWQRDIILSAIKPIDAHEQEITKEAFIVMIAVMDSLGTEDFLSEFALAAEKGFGSLDQCGLFHIKFLDYLIPKLSQDESKYDTIFKRFISGIDRVVSVPPTFFAIASKLITLSRESDVIRSIMNPYIMQMLEILASKFAEVLSLMDKNIVSNQEIGDLYNSWGQFIYDFIWLETISKELIPSDIIITFCEDELIRCSEQWRIKAAVRGLIAVYEMMNVSKNLLPEAIQKMHDTKEKIKSTQLLEQLIIAMKKKANQEQLYLFESI